MKIKKFIYSLSIFSATALATSAQAQTYYLEEDPVYIRFEQYTGTAGALAFWRLPTPGTSNFPGSNCKAVSIPNDRVEQASRFMALYLFAKTNSKKVFYIYDINTCSIVSFGTNG